MSMKATYVSLHDISSCKISEHFSKDHGCCWKTIRCYGEDNELICDITLFGSDQQLPKITKV